MKIYWIFKFSQPLFMLYQYLSGKEIAGTLKVENILYCWECLSLCTTDTAIESVKQNKNIHFPQSLNTSEYSLVLLSFIKDKITKM